MPPSWLHEPNSTYYAVETSSVMFHCSANGQPAAQVLWKHLPPGSSAKENADAQSIAQYQLIRSGPHYQVFQNGSLRISEVHARIDAGLFLCHANNGIGSGLSKVVTLIVNGKRIFFLF